MASRWRFGGAINVMLVLASLAVGCAALELYARVIAPPFGARFYKLDPELGWAPRPDVSVMVDATDAAGTPHRDLFRTNGDGFRAWEDTASTKPKVLFVGDSFTGDPTTGNDEAYFNQIKALVDVASFAVGGGGYGTLQELLLIRRYIDKIRPDLMVLQFCSNDFANNSIEIEDRSIVRNQSNFRPYWVDGSIRFRNAPLYTFLYAHSHLFHYLDYRTQRLQYAYYRGYGPPDGPDEHRRKLDQAERITRDLLALIASAAPPHTTLATFSCDTTSSDLTARWLRSAAAAGFDAWPEVSRAVEAAQREGRTVRALDGMHWSPLGHRIAAAQLAGKIGPLLARLRKP